MNEKIYPLNRERLREEYEELVLKAALVKYMERHSEEARRWLDTLPEPPCRAGFAKALEQEQAKEKRHRTAGRVFHTAGKIVTKAAVVFLVLALSFTTVFAASSGFREAVVRRAFQKFGLFETEVLPPETAPPVFDADRYQTEHCYGFTDLPEGFVMSRTFEPKGMAVYVYYVRENPEDGTRDTLTLGEIPPGSSWQFNVSTERAESGFMTEVNGQEACCITEPGKTTLLWEQGGWLLHLSGTIPGEELLRVAQGVQKIR